MIPLFTKYHISSGRLNIPFPGVVEVFIVTKVDWTSFRTAMRIEGGSIFVGNLKENEVIEFFISRSKRHACRVLEINRFEITLEEHRTTSKALVAAREARPAEKDPFRVTVPTWVQTDFDTVPLWAELRTEGLIAGWRGAGADQ